MARFFHVTVERGWPSPHFAAYPGVLVRGVTHSEDEQVERAFESGASRGRTWSDGRVRPLRPGAGNSPAVRVLAERVSTPVTPAGLFTATKTSNSATSRIVYGEPMGEVLVCSDHEADFLYWFREEGGEPTAAKRRSAEFHEWFQGGNRVHRMEHSDVHVQRTPAEVSVENNYAGIRELKEEVSSRSKRRTRPFGWTSANWTYDIGRRRRRGDAGQRRHHRPVDDRTSACRNCCSSTRRS